MTTVRVGTKVMVLGATGIIGQTMRLMVPNGIVPIWVRREEDPLYEGCDLTDPAATKNFLERWQPHVIINLAGEGRTDIVETHWRSAAMGETGGLEAYAQDVAVNVGLPQTLAAWCDEKGSFLIHVSSQGVFSGQEAPYRPDSPVAGVNEYGRQKARAEEHVRASRQWTIVRLTFVLGIRPMPQYGRENPLEGMLRLDDQVQVNDRYFSVCFARDAAELLWEMAVRPIAQTIHHFGIPRVSMTREAIARMVNARAGRTVAIKGVEHDHFPNLAQRPLDTTWDTGALYRRSIPQGLDECVTEWRDQVTLTPVQRARELALFFGRREDDAAQMLGLGFLMLHEGVRQDFLNANPQTDDELLQWYRDTHAYCWELSAYHADPGFNYAGMCLGIAAHLRAYAIEQRILPGQLRVLCLGDGIGDLTLVLHKAGFAATYHDLAHSVTAAFAMFRLNLHDAVGTPLTLSQDWQPELPLGPYDVVLGLDFFEHLPNVEEWATAVVNRLRPGGLFLSQNAFAQGDPEHGGSIPMHLSRNNHWEKDWDPLRERLGLGRTGQGEWWVKRW